MGGRWAGEAPEMKNAKLYENLIVAQVKVCSSNFFPGTQLNFDSLVASLLRLYTKGPECDDRSRATTAEASGNMCSPPSGLPSPLDKRSQGAAQ